jgi:hypothetical protein
VGGGYAGLWCVERDWDAVGQSGEWDDDGWDLGDLRWVWVSWRGRGGFAFGIE